ncbi:MAG: MFS transporter [Myxococcales bacterium]|nr:MFS transporter [Myxococcales bacterium]
MATPRGRLTAFFCLYLTEGIPYGFTITAMSTYMRRMGLGPAEITSFVAALMLPWAFKWAIAPIVDAVAPRRFGRRRAWIIAMQLGMMLTLGLAVPIDFVEQLGLFTSLILMHNVFGATQDVAIDALACEVLEEKERGLASGLMFGAAYIGITIGGSGSLFLSDYLKQSYSDSVALKASFLMVIAILLVLHVAVAWRIKEEAPPPRPSSPELDAVLGRNVTPIQTISRAMKTFLRETWRSFTSSRGAIVAVFFALLPAGALSLNYAAGNSLAVELGFKDSELALMGMFGGLLSATACILGGRLSDVIGRRKIILVCYLTTSILTVVMALELQGHGWILPLSAEQIGSKVGVESLLAFYWTLNLVFAIPQGLAFGVKSAIFMDVTSKAVAATQFTAYMALSNFATSYSAKWTGSAVESWGYPKAMMFDAVLGVLCLLCLPFLGKVAEKDGAKVSLS